MQTKSIFTSKTIAAFIPVVQKVVAAHPAETLIVLGLINTGLRYITKGKVSLFGD